MPQSLSAHTYTLNTIAVVSNYRHTEW